MTSTIKLAIGQKEMTFNFGLRFMGELLDEANMGIDEVVDKFQKNPFKMIPLIMYVSAKHGAGADGKEFEMNFGQFVDFLDNNGGIGQESVITFMKRFVENLTAGVPKTEEDQVDDEEAKKK